MAGNNKQTLEERAEIFLAEWQSKYSNAIAEARAAAETTSTAAWQENYLKEMTDHRKVVRDNALVAISTLKAIADTDTCEAHEKDVKEAIKTMCEERIRHDAWVARCVLPYARTANRCQELLNSIETTVDVEEKNTALLNRGLSNAVMKMVQQWPRARWIEKTGQVVIDNEEANAAKKSA